MCFKRKTRISYAWRIYLPRIATITTLVVVMALWQVYRERNYHREFVEQQLGYVAERAVNCNNAGVSIPQFLDFVHNYYSRHTFSRGIRVSIYDTHTWRPLFEMGGSYNMSPEKLKELTLNVSHKARSTEELCTGGTTEYIYRSSISEDGNIAVLASVPMNNALDDYIEGNTNEVWVIAAFFALLVYISEGFTAWRFGRNIKILRDFAQRSSLDPDYTPEQDFAHDELGDIARQIVKMHNERLAARRERDHEHEIAINAVREKAQQKRQLTNNINHEIKTPIGVIKGYLDILADDNSLSDEMRKDFLLKARAYADRLVNLVNDISAITRLDEGAGMIVTEPTDYHDIAYTTSEDLSTSGILGNMKFTFDVPIGTIVKGNNTLLAAMLLNLAKNSVNYSRGTFCRLELFEPTEEDIQFLTNQTNAEQRDSNDDDTHYNISDSRDAEKAEGSASSPEDFLYFRFYDDGVGVPEEHLKHIFQRFYRIESGRGRKSGGTGLGLAIVFNTVTAHGGSIKAKNHVTGGLEIIFSLPKFTDNQRTTNCN